MGWSLPLSYEGQSHDQKARCRRELPSAQLRRWQHCSRTHTLFRTEFASCSVMFVRPSVEVEIKRRGEVRAEDSQLNLPHTTNKAASWRQSK